jgi:hypothetical protein
MLCSELDEDVKPMQSQHTHSSFFGHCDSHRAYEHSAKSSDRISVTRTRAAAQTTAEAEASNETDANVPCTD